jgi:hypothetical protein
LNDLLAQFNSEGEQGYRSPEGTQFLCRSITDIDLGYMKDQAQSSTFIYKSDDALPTTSAAFINQANNNGAQGYAYYGAFTDPQTGNCNTVYIKASNCSGALCTVLNWVESN